MDILGYNVSTVDQAFLVFVFYILDLYLQHINFHSVDAWFDCLYPAVRFNGWPLNFAFIRKQIAPCLFNNQPNNCLHCITVDALKYCLFGKPFNYKKILIGDSMAAGLHLVDTYVVVLSSARLKTIVRSASFLSKCVPDVKIIILSFTCDFVPYPHPSSHDNRYYGNFKSNSYQVTSQTDFQSIFTDLNTLLEITDYKEKVTMFSPFPRPEFQMTHSKQPKCYRFPKALSNDVKEFNDLFIDYCLKHGISCINLFDHITPNIDHFRKEDVHLNPVGRSVLQNIVTTRC